MPNNLANDQTFITLRRDLPLDLNLLLQAWNLDYKQAAFDAALDEIKRLKIEIANLRCQLSLTGIE